MARWQTAPLSTVVVVLVSRADGRGASAGRTDFLRATISRNHRKCIRRANIKAVMFL